MTPQPKDMEQLKKRGGSIYCDMPKCEKVIGHYPYIGRDVYYDGTYQIGFNSYCSEKHLDAEHE